MIVIAPGSHPEADTFWKEKLGSRPNGARTLGSAIAKNLADVFEPYYDMLVCYASDIKFDIPKGVKRIAVIWHQNYPWTEGFKVWQRVNVKLKNYDVDYFVNEQTLMNLIDDVYKQVYFMPRFIDTTEYPKFNCKKTIPTLWFGNAWGEFQNEFKNYKEMVAVPLWISHNKMAVGDKEPRELNRKTTLQTLAKTKVVWAIGISQLEAQFYGCEVISYRGPVIPFYDQDNIREYMGSFLQKEIRPLGVPRLRK